MSELLAYFPGTTETNLSARAKTSGQDKQALGAVSVLLLSGKIHTPVHYPCHNNL